MKARDANDTLREEGPEALRARFDGAYRFDGGGSDASAGGKGHHMNAQQLAAALKATPLGGGSRYLGRCLI